MSELLKVENLCKSHILKNLSFSLEEGEMTAVMGPSGSGKSTLLYQLAGMDQPSGGKVWLKGQEIIGLSEDEKAYMRLHRMGFVFQQMNMMANLNLMDNILLPAIQANREKRKDKRSRAELVNEAKNLMEKLSVAELAGRRITEVSGGQLQRACICRSLMNHPQILFADEPTGALNQSAASEVMDELVKLNREGMTILMVTHDSKVASQCDCILYLLDGEICGELRLEGSECEDEKPREEIVARWLRKMGW